ncbi:hypothetical protein ACI2KR_07740 [Pseudomonas luteola]
MKALTIALTLFVILIFSVSQQKRLFDNYQPSVGQHDLISNNQNPLDESLIASMLTYSHGKVMPVFINETDKKDLSEDLNWSFITNRTAADKQKLKDDILSDKWLVLSTTPSNHGVQSACLILYTKSFSYPDNLRWKQLGSQRLSEVKLGRASAYHEFEHCLMQQWMLDYAVEQLLKSNPGVVVNDYSYFRKMYRLTLGEIFADVFAISFMDEPLETKMTIMDFRDALYKNHLLKGTYAFNHRVLEAMREQKLFSIGENTEKARLRLLNFSLENLPLPTPAEIKSNFAM